MFKHKLYKTFRQLCDTLQHFTQIFPHREFDKLYKFLNNSLNTQHVTQLVNIILHSSTQLLFLKQNFSKRSKLYKTIQNCTQIFTPLYKTLLVCTTLYKQVYNTSTQLKKQKLDNILRNYTTIMTKLCKSSTKIA
jgi:hypothetical protein